MRHRRRANNLSRDPSHRDAMLKNMVVSLFRHEKIKTSPAKAKAARMLAEKMITLGKKGTLHARRLAISRLGNKAAVRKLFTELGPRYQGRSGGYTRIMRLPNTIRLPASEAASTFKRSYGRRLGDGSEQVYLQLVEAEVSSREHSTSARRARRKKRRTDFFESGAKPEKKAAEADAADAKAPEEEKAEAKVEAAEAVAEEKAPKKAKKAKKEAEESSEPKKAKKPKKAAKKAKKKPKKEE